MQSAFPLDPRFFILKALERLLASRIWRNMHVLRIWVKVRRVQRVFDLRHEWCDLLLRIKGCPVKLGLLEPLVVHDVLDPALEVSEAVCRVHRQELGDEVHGTSVHVLGEVQVSAALNDAFEDLLLGVVLEWRVANEELIDKASQRPIVRALVVAFGKYKLRRQVLGCAAQREALGRGTSILYERDALGETEVDHLEETLGGHQQVLRLEITVGNTFAVNVVES
mmetsp:Transcript_12863/g.37385  ORF Transcript_12863/g.37385 Transcript_12863/m.37385 type:complete len:224 (-) Transcript_12863:1816-2487(-)